MGETNPTATKERLSRQFATGIKATFVVCRLFYIKFKTPYHPMAKKKPDNHGKDWTQADTEKLEKLAKRGISTEDIAKKLKRTEPAIYSKASEKKIPLMPKDKS